MSAPDSRLLRGYASAREVTRRHAKSFYFASWMLFGARRRAAFALYAFCRRLDDLVDEGSPSIGNLSERLGLASSVVERLYETSALPEDAPWPHDELLALRHTIRRYHVPKAPFLDLIAGMSMDVSKTRYETFEQLDLYCYRVAGTVGLLMSPVLGVREERAAEAAAALGKAMQLTNILRDIREDYARGRVYVPRRELEQFGVTEAALAEGRVDERFVALMQFQIERAERLYALGATGFGAIRHFGGRTTVRLMSAIYRRILAVIRASQFDVFSQRARVPLSSKLLIAARLPLSP